MREEQFTVISNERLSAEVYSLTMSGNVADVMPGQFAEIKVDGLFLRRPISVCDCDGKENIRFVYKVVGRGTEEMSLAKAGDKFDILLPLGNGFDMKKSGDEPVLAGGGVGLPPMLYLAKELKKIGKNVRVVMGFNRADEAILYDDFVNVVGKDKVTVTTVDGSLGVKGFVTNADLNGSYLYACGPKPMLKAIAATTKNGEISLEERMGCGFGACMGCSVMTVSGAKRVCREGPVFDISEVIW